MPGDLSTIEEAVNLFKRPLSVKPACKQTVGYSAIWVALKMVYYCQYLEFFLAKHLSGLVSKLNMPKVREL
jgi:hypothetical protein